MCLPRFSLVEKYDDDTSYTNSRPVVRRPSAVHGSVYLPLNSLRSLKSKHSHSSGSEAHCCDYDLGQFVTRRNGYHPLHGNRGDSKMIVVDNSGAKRSGSGATAVEISDDRNGTTTTILAADGRQSNSSLKSVCFNKYKFEKTFTTPDSDSSSSSDDDDTSSASSTDSDDSHRSHRGRSHHRSSSRSRSHSGSRSKSRSRSRSRPRSVDSQRRNFYIPPYPHLGHGYPLYHQQRAMPVPMAAPAPMMQAYPQNMDPSVQPQRQIGAGLITAQPQQMVMQPVPQMSMHDPTHGIHGQYYQGPRVGPVVSQTMVPLMVGPHHPLPEPDEDQG
ncbi:uncharacterized protein DFL_005894 [Arthrobotrys flagrans]|uniref:Uncharacterized protein n=1 Tax=Arthrobotrys flagrans TaxID=97331 RepID=A0A436ZYQ0_ARTFL|nr:hypothetical protein DFL_005894 [Arthrobotrys flagrans]